MKKIFNIFIFALCATVAFTSCRDDSDYYDEPEVAEGGPIRIVSRETSFDAPAASGKIVVEANGPVSVTSSDETDWVSTEVDENNVITVSVTTNEELDGRTCMLTISSGKYSTRLAVYQAGSFFDLKGESSIAQNDASKTYSYTYDTNLSGELEFEVYEYVLDVAIPSDFITITKTENGFTAVVKANNTGLMRKGYISWSYGNQKGTIPVVQYDFDNDMGGQYILAYFKTAADTAPVGIYVDFVKDGTNYYLDLGNDRTVPVSFDESTFKLDLLGGQYVGEYVYKSATHYLYTVAGDMDKGYISLSSAVGMTGTVETVLTTDGTLMPWCDFVDNGVWGSYVVNYIDIQLFTAKAFISDNRAKVYTHRWIQPFMYRPTPAAAAVTSQEKSSLAIRSNVKAVVEPEIIEFDAETVEMVDEYTARIVR